MTKSRVIPSMLCFVLAQASSMTYAFDGEQNIAVAAGSNIISFAILD